jgi:alkylated DNA nucleotide flippase Atl1
LPSAYDEEVLDLVAQIPKGKALSYSDVAALIGRGGPRQVGHTMAAFGSGVPWWRVLRADGSPAPMVAEQALDRLRADGTPMRASAERVDWAAARWAGP